MRASILSPRRTRRFLYRRKDGWAAITIRSMAQSYFNCLVIYKQTRPWLPFCTYALESDARSRLELAGSLVLFCSLDDLASSSQQLCLCQSEGATHPQSGSGLIADCYSTHTKVGQCLCFLKIRCEYYRRSVEFSHLRFKGCCRLYWKPLLLPLAINTVACKRLIMGVQGQVQINLANNTTPATWCVNSAHTYKWNELNMLDLTKFESYIYYIKMLL